MGSSGFSLMLLQKWECLHTRNVLCNGFLMDMIFVYNFCFSYFWTRLATGKVIPSTIFVQFLFILLYFYCRFWNQGYWKNHLAGRPYHIRYVSGICHETQYLMRCAIWYQLHNLKNVKNTHWGVLILVQWDLESTDTFQIL